MKRRTKVILWVIVVILGMFGASIPVLKIKIAQDFNNPVLIAVQSPASPNDEIWLIESGFQDRSMELCVKIPSVNGGKPKQITTLDWSGLRSIQGVRWSKDGRLAILVFVLADHTEQDEICAFAFDFNSGKALLPPWSPYSQSPPKTLTDWRRHEKSVMGLIETHGGLGDQGITKEEFDAHSREIWYWQIPSS